MMLEPFLLLLAGLLAALLGLLLSWIARRLERIRTAAAQQPPEGELAAVVVEPALRPARWPRAAVAPRGATGMPAERVPRRDRLGLRSRADLRRAIVLATILGPPAGRPPAGDGAGISRERWW